MNGEGYSIVNRVIGMLVVILLLGLAGGIMVSHLIMVISLRVQPISIQTLGTGFVLLTILIMLATLPHFNKYW